MLPGIVSEHIQVIEVVFGHQILLQYNGEFQQTSDVKRRGPCGRMYVAHFSQKTAVPGTVDRGEQTRLIASLSEPLMALAEARA